MAALLVKIRMGIAGAANKNVTVTYVREKSFSKISCNVDRQRKERIKNKELKIPLGVEKIVASGIEQCKLR